MAIGAAGSLPGDMQRMWRPTGIDSYNMEYGYSTMGYEVAGALGVKLAIGDKREVYAMCGDGSFNMLHGELVTAVMEHKKINICLFDNASFGCINNLQVGHGNVTLCTELRYRNKDGLFGDFLNIDLRQGGGGLRLQVLLHPHHGGAGGGLRGRQEGEGPPGAVRHQGAAQDHDRRLRLLVARGRQGGGGGGRAGGRVGLSRASGRGGGVGVLLGGGTPSSPFPPVTSVTGERRQAPGAGIFGRRMSCRK